jgi:hypothetical protein
MLDNEQIGIIKSFPDTVLQTVKKHLQSLPRTEYDNVKVNFNAICELCITECKRKNMKIDKIMLRLQEYARANPEPVYEPSYSTKIKYQTYNDNKDFRRGSPSYTLFKKNPVRKLSTEEANKNVNSILSNVDSFKDFSKLVGESVAIQYQKRMIDNIISVVDR